MNRIAKLFKENKDILSVFYTAGHPTKDSTVMVGEELVKNGVSMLEIGMPFSDPIADGPVIQASNLTALQCGMTLSQVLSDVARLRTRVDIPLLLMGDINPVLQMGVERFLKTAHDAGVDGVVIPSLPFDVYLKQYKTLFNEFHISFVPLITQHTTPERIRLMDENTDGFIYLVSAPSVTGNPLELDKERTEYFKRIQSMNLKNPIVIGFGIDSAERLRAVWQYAPGAIVGSAFVKAIDNAKDVTKVIQAFVDTLL